MSSITSASVYPLMDRNPNVTILFLKHRKVPEVWRELFTTKVSLMDHEMLHEKKPLGMAGIKLAGQGIQGDTMGIIHSMAFYHDVYAQKFSIDGETLSDISNTYKNDFPDSVSSLLASLSKAKRYAAANIFNLGAVTIGLDGVPLFSNDHPIYTGGSQSNLLNIALSETAIEAGDLAIKEFQDPSGDPCGYEIKALLVCQTHAYKASVLANSQYKTSIGNNQSNLLNQSLGANDRSSIFTMGLIPKVIVDQQLTSKTIAILISNAPKGLMHLERSKPKHRNWRDMDRDSMVYLASERYKFAVGDYRSVCALSL